MELAKAYVQIIPTTEGIKNNITNELNNEVSSAGKSVGLSWGNALGTIVTSAVGLATTAIGTAGTAVIGLTKQAIEGYAEYEQLVGGVETLFKDSADAVVANANQAFKTAGLSANEYMDTVTSFSASLLQSLGGNTEEAVKVADRAIVDMSDNANKMGTSMESIQNAYQGFAKQNYTMLDNLKLGYGGTKEEMKRLISEASKMTDSMAELGVEVDSESLSFNNIVNAISVVQNELGITGTTALEASTTIEGSLNSMKSAWSNLIVAMSDDTIDFDKAIKDFVDSVVGEDGNGGVVGNLIPRIEKTLNGVGDLVTKLAPIIAEKIPPMITSTMPTLLKAVKSLVQAVADNLPALIKAITAIMPDLMNTIVDAMLVLLPVLVDCALELVETLADGIADSLPVLIPPVTEMILKIADTIVNHLDTILQCAFHIIDALIDGLIEASPMLLDQGAKLMTDFALSIVNQLWTTIDAGTRIIDSLIKGLENKLPQLWGVARGIPQKIVDKFKENDYRLSNLGGTLALDILNGFKSYFDTVLGNGNWVSNIVSNLINKVVSAFSLQIASVDWGSSAPSVTVPTATVSAQSTSTYSYTSTPSTQNVNVTIKQDKNATYKATVSSSYKTSKASGIPSSVLSKIG